MNWDQIKQHIAGFKIGIAGCGGLGSNAAVALARVGVKRFVLADFDVVEASNLNRQYYFSKQIGQKKVHALHDNLLQIYKDITLELHDKMLHFEDIVPVFGDCDLMLEAFDKAEAKQMLTEAMMCFMPDKVLIIGNGMAGVGNFETIKQLRWSENVYVCGDQITEISADQPPLAPRVGIVSNMQANLALELLLKMKPKKE